MNAGLSRLIFLFIGFCLINCLISYSMAQETPSIVQTIEQTNVQPKKEARLWNLQDADIISVINEVSQETGKNFIIDPRVTGKITLISSKPLRQQEVYQVFLSVLGMLGYSAIPSGNVIKIVPNMESGEQAVPIMTKNTGMKGEEVVVRIIPLQNISATQLIPILRPMLPQWSNIAVYTPGNILILLGRAANLERILNIIQDVDKAAVSGIEVVPLRHASAAQIAVILNNLQNAGRSSGDSTGVAIAADERSNSILLSGLKTSRIRLRALISQLDMPGTSSFGNTEVVYLRYLQAKTFAPLIGKIAQNILGKGSDTTSTGGSSSNLPNLPSAQTGSAASKPGEPANTTNIQAEPNTNALIITAPPALMRSLKSVIAKLDIRPAQVAVEAIIAEIDEGNDSNLGIQWGGFAPTFGAAPAANGNATGVIAQGSIGILPGIHDLTAVLTMLQTLKGVDILSTPSIMVLDNQPAVIEIGTAISTQTGSYTTPTGGATPAGSPTPFTTTEYKNVTLKLDVTPQINLGSSVRLKLKLKNDTLAGPAPVAGGNPPINTSSITNTVLVNHDDILVLGGLIQNTTNESIVRIPIIGDVPVVGKLFEHKSLTQTKKNLMVFIKPSIVHSGEDAMLISRSKYHHAQRAQAGYRETLESLGRSGTSVRKMLPPWQNPKDIPPPFPNHSD
jgi:general secretion pathway protein D